MAGTGDRTSGRPIRILSDRKVSFAEGRRQTMARQDEQMLNEDSGPMPEKEKKAGKSWAEEHGGLIFLIIVFSAISFVVLYESCMQ
jgi:hypothetical protein